MLAFNTWKTDKIFVAISFLSNPLQQLAHEDTYCGGISDKYALLKPLTVELPIVFTLKCTDHTRCATFHGPRIKSKRYKRSKN